MRMRTKNHSCVRYSWQSNGSFSAKSREQLRRWGSVLLLVVVVVAMLALASYNFALQMTTELEAASMYTADVQAKMTADSGIEFAAVLIGNRSLVSAENLVHNPILFRGQVVSASPHARANGRFSIIAPVEHDLSNNAIRYGLMDESAKLNLNYLAGNGVDTGSGLTNDQIHTWLMNVPNMTAEIIDAILDWIDSDDTVNPFGAESGTYQAMSPAYKAKNGPLESMDELLLVKGITPTLLYGEDANRNGILDPNENDGAASPPLDNADGKLDHGFIAYFSVHGRESNRGPGGKLKINVNSGYLDELYDQLEKEESLGKPVADFIVAYRLTGADGKPAVSKTNPPVTTTTSGASASPSTSSSSTSTASKSTSNSSSNTSTSSSSSSQNAGSSSSSTTAAPQSTTDAEAAAGLAQWLTYVTAQGGKVTRGDMDLSKGGQTTIDSLWSLVGDKLTSTPKGVPKPIPSPWSSDPATLMTTMPLLYDKLTVTSDDYLEGRINVNQARREILLGIPTITEAIVDGIIAAQQLDANGVPSVDALSQHSSIAWLVAQNLVDLPGMISLDPYITVHGDIYRVQVLGYFDGGGPVSRVEAMIDGTQVPPRIIMQRDLNELGRGYSRMQILPAAVTR